MLLLVAQASPSLAQLSPPATWAARAANNYQIAANLTYLTASKLRIEAGRVLPARRDDAAADDRVLPWRVLGRRLTKAGVPNQLLTIPEGGHGNFTPEERTKIFATIRAFLAKNGLGEAK